MAERRENWQILTASRKKTLTVKIFLSTIYHFESAKIYNTVSYTYTALFSLYMLYSYVLLCVCICVVLELT